MTLPLVAVDRCGDAVTLAHVLTVSAAFESATGWDEPLLPSPRTRRLITSNGAKAIWPVELPVQTAPSGFTVGWSGRSIAGAISDDTTVVLTAGFGFEEEEAAALGSTLAAENAQFASAEVGVVYRMGEELMYGVPREASQFVSEVLRGRSGIVRRGVAGTTAVEHEVGTRVYRLHVPPPLESAAIRAAGIAQQAEALTANKNGALTLADSYTKELVAFYARRFEAGPIWPVKEDSDG